MRDDTNIFVINLKDKEHRFKVFEELKDSRIQRFEAVDTRDNPKKYEEFGLKLNPVGLVNKLYFSQMYGAIGCFLSHFSIWKKIINENLESALILEDDASCCDVASFLEESNEFSLMEESQTKIDLVQLNKRTSTDERIFTKFFDGTESYYVTNEGAKKLLNFVADSHEFQNKVYPKPLKTFKRNGNTFKQRDYDVYKNENIADFDWNKKNNIPAPVDKFIGYCATSDLSDETKIKIQVSKKIGLHYQKIPSDILLDGEVGHWEITETETNEFMNSNKFMWWGK